MINIRFKVLTIANIMTAIFNDPNLIILIINVKIVKYIKLEIIQFCYNKYHALVMPEPIAMPIISITLILRLKWKQLQLVQRYDFSLLILNQYNNSHVHTQILAVPMTNVDNIHI